MYMYVCTCIECTRSGKWNPTARTGSVCSLFVSASVSLSIRHIRPSQTTHSRLTTNTNTRWKELRQNLVKYVIFTRVLLSFTLNMSTSLFAKLDTRLGKLWRVWPIAVCVSSLEIFMGSPIHRNLMTDDRAYPEIYGDIDWTGVVHQFWTHLLC